MTAKPLLFATTNPLKFTIANDVCRAQGIKLVQRKLEIDEIQSEEPERIINDKVRRAYEVIQEPVVVSDDTWIIPGLKGFPGPYMKSVNHWFGVQDFINLTQQLADRRILLETRLAYTDGVNTKLFSRTHSGILLMEPRGPEGTPGHAIISMDGDDGRSIAEVFESGQANRDKEVATIWHDFVDFWIHSRGNK